MERILEITFSELSESVLETMEACKREEEEERMKESHNTSVKETETDKVPEKLQSLIEKISLLESEFLNTGEEEEIEKYLIMKRDYLESRVQTSNSEIYAE